MPRLGAILRHETVCVIGNAISHGTVLQSWRICCGYYTDKYIKVICLPLYFFSFFPSSGYYVYIESSSPAQSGDTSALISPDIAAGNTRCLEFFYHMYGVNVGSLEVQTLDTDDGSALPQRIWRKSGNRGETWQRGLVTIDATTNTIQVSILTHLPLPLP